MQDIVTAGDISLCLITVITSPLVFSTWALVQRLSKAHIVTTALTLLGMPHNGLQWVSCSQIAFDICRKGGIVATCLSFLASDY